jgi:hypothetical protein
MTSPTRCSFDGLMLSPSRDFKTEFFDDAEVGAFGMSEQPWPSFVLGMPMHVDAAHASVPPAMVPTNNQQAQR